MAKYRVLVTGGRDYKKATNVYAALDRLRAERGDLVVIEGGAEGADMFAAMWAEAFKETGIEHEPYPANWITYGPAAGGIRNKEMLDVGKPDIVVAFPGGSGTRNMVKQARQVGVEVIYGEEYLSE